MKMSKTLTIDGIDFSVNKSDDGFTVIAPPSWPCPRCQGGSRVVITSRVLFKGEGISIDCPSCGIFAPDQA